MSGRVTGSDVIAGTVGFGSVIATGAVFPLDEPALAGVLSADGGATSCCAGTVALEARGTEGALARATGREAVAARPGCVATVCSAGRRGEPLGATGAGDP